MSAPLTDEQLRNIKRRGADPFNDNGDDIDTLLAEIKRLRAQALADIGTALAEVARLRGILDGILVEIERMARGCDTDAATVKARRERLTSLREHIAGKAPSRGAVCLGVIGTGETACGAETVAGRGSGRVGEYTHDPAAVTCPACLAGKAAPSLDGLAGLAARGQS